MINKEKMQFFEQYGCVKYGPGEVFSEAFIQELREITVNNLPSWEEGEIDPLSVNAREDFRFSEQFNIKNHRFKGIARSHRYTRGKGALNPHDNSNWLYGKRSTLRSQHWPGELISLIENESILNLVRSYLSCENLSFHNGSISAVFPGCTGEEMSVHADTIGFSENNQEAYKHHVRGSHLLNIMIYLDDVDMDLAPTKIFPCTNIQYDEINNHIARYFKESGDKNFYFNSGTLYEELLPPSIKEPIFFVGKKGSINLMNSSVLHGSTENKTNNRTRLAVILNYSKYEDLHFRKIYKIDKSDLLNFRNNIQDKKLIDRSFIYKKERIYLKNYLRLFKSRIGKYIPRYPTGEIVGPLNFLNSLKSSTTNPDIDKKEYLNLGAGPNWRHNNIVSLDYDSPFFPGTSEISFDLNKKAPLPFTPERFKGVYTSHNLEHLQESQVPFILKELHRCMKEGAVLRVTLPDMIAHLQAYDNRDIKWFDWIRNKGFYKFDCWLRLVVRSFAGSIVDEYTNEELHELYKKMSHEEFLDFFTFKVDQIEDKSLLASDIHKSWWSHEKMIGTLLELGFSSASKVNRFESSEPLFLDRSYRRDNKYFNMTRPDKSIFVEAIK